MVYRLFVFFKMLLFSYWRKNAEHSIVCGGYFGLVSRIILTYPNNGIMSDLSTIAIEQCSKPSLVDD